MRFVRCKTTTEYEAMILTPEQAYAVLRNLREPEHTLTLLAAGTGLAHLGLPGTAMASAASGSESGHSFIAPRRRRRTGR